jgi:hypothetical protein
VVFKLFVSRESSEFSLFREVTDVFFFFFASEYGKNTQHHAPICIRCVHYIFDKYSRLGRAAVRPIEIPHPKTFILVFDQHIASDANRPCREL